MTFTSMARAIPLIAATAALAWACPATAQVTLTYVRGGPLPSATIRAPDGRLFTLALQGSDGEYILSLLLLGHRKGARNQLEPSAHWHGLWPFMLMADDLAPTAPAERRIYGRERDIPVRDYPFWLRVTLRDLELDGSARFDFKRLTLTAELHRAE